MLFFSIPAARLPGPIYGDNNIGTINTENRI